MRLRLWNWLALVLLAGGGVLARAQEPNLPSQPIPVTPASAQETNSPAPPATMPPNQSSPLPPPNALPGNVPAPPPGGYMQPVPPPPGAVLVQPVPPPRGVFIYEPLGAWFDADYLLWWTKGTHVPQLVTPAVPPGSGAIGPAEPTVLFPGGNGDFGARSGGKFDLGFWFSDNHVLGVEAGYFFLGTDRSNLGTGLESSAIALPIGFMRDRDPSIQRDPPVLEPNLPFGNFAVTQSSFLQSAEVNLLACLCSSCSCRLNFLAGFRFLELDEKLHVAQEFVSADGSEDDAWDDEWHTRNQFYGGQLGARATFTRDRFFADVGGLVALGATHQRVDINGSLTQTGLSSGFDAFGNPVTNIQVAQSSGGLLNPQPASFSRNIFAVVPQFNFDVGYEFNNFCRASVGYEFLYWSSVARPGDQVGGIPKATSFWAQGLVFSLGFMF